MKHATLEDLKFELWFRQRNDGDIKFTNAFGDSLSIKDMSTSNIIDAIKSFK